MYYSIKVKEKDLFDTPIDYYKINSTHYSTDYQVEMIEDIVSDNNGYITDSVFAKFSSYEIGEKFTALINAGVGQGKSTSVNKLAKYYIENGFKVIIASPFNSIVDDYYNSFIAENPELSEECFTINLIRDNKIYDDEGNYLIEKYAKCKFHVVTTNLLLRNPGDFFEQAKEKRDYLNELIRSSGENSLVVIFDEIHASIQNFSFDKIIKYSSFRNCISKQFLISATFNPASVLVSKYLSLHTNNAIKITNVPRKQSNRLDINGLHLHIFNRIYDNNGYDNIFDVLTEIIKDSFDKQQTIKILSFSARICETICSNGRIRSILDANGIRPKICNATTGNLPSNEDAFVVGTNFNTGKSFRNGSLIILLPPKSNFSTSALNTLGIFNEGGSDTLIQSVARMRHSGDIHIIISEPNYYLYSPHPYLENYTKYISIPERNKQPKLRFNDHDEEIRRYYNEMKTEFISEINFNLTAYQESKIPNITYPTFEEFLLLEGRKYIDIRNKTHGSNIIPFILYAAFHNQFENCKLKSLNTFRINERIDSNDDLYNLLDKIFSQKPNPASPLEFSNEAHLQASFLCDLDAYFYLIELVKTKQISSQGRNIDFMNVTLNRELLRFLYRYKCNISMDYTEELFFNHQMYLSKKYMDNIEANQYMNEKTGTELELIRKFKRLYDLCQQFCLITNEEFIEKSITGTKYIAFFEPLQSEITEIAVYLFNHHHFLKNKIFNFLRTSQLDKNRLIPLDSIFTVFKKINLITIKKKVVKKVNRQNISFEQIIGIVKEPNSETDCLNLTFTYPIKPPSVGDRILEYLGFETIGEL